jgi:hypothetical protein
MKMSASSKLVTADSSIAIPSRIAAVGPAAVALIIIGLHALKPEFEPSWRFISEYAIGRHAWIMKGGFLIWAVSCAALALALWQEVRNRAGKVGVGILLLVAAAMVPAGLFPQDPITAAPNELTTSGSIHALASMIGIPGLPIAAVLISSSLWRTNTLWRPSRSLIMATAHATWISLALMTAYLVWAVPRAGGFNAEVWAGSMNRLVVGSYLAWQIATACCLLRHAKRTNALRLTEKQL